MENFSAKNVFNDIRNFLAGRFLGATRDEFFLEEIVKLVFCKYELVDRNTEELNEIELSGLYRKVFHSVLDNYPDIYGGQDQEIQLDPISIRYIDSRLNLLDISNLNRDIIGDAYEIFIGDSIKGQSGQFFTPQNAAKALVDMIEPSTESSIMDPTCGAGGFLIATLKYWQQSGKQCHCDKLFGIDKDEYLTRLCKIHLACMRQNTHNVKCSDSLSWDQTVLGPNNSAYDVILTNPPFGVNIQAGAPETLSRFELAYKYKRDKNGATTKTDALNLSVPPQVVFMEQCVNIVKEDGYIGIVVPESMISNKKYSYVVKYIVDHCQIKAVIGMPDDLFKTSGKGGTHTKTCLLVLQKKMYTEKKAYEIFMAEAKWCGHDSRGRKIPNDDIPTIVENYRKYKNGKGTPGSNLGFTIMSSEIKNDVLAPRAYTISTCEHHTLNETHHLITIGQLISEGILSVSTGNELGKLAYGTGDVPFIRTSDISNWEIKSDPKHLVSKDLYESLAEKQDVKEGDILMVKDGSYLIGTCAMITQYDTRIIYQSHLYKIRVCENNKYGLDRYYLLAALSSDFVRKQIVANTFSHDIINSLGDRLKELVIPIAKKAEKRNQIVTMVKKSIDESIEARELAKRARLEVVS